MEINPNELHTSVNLTLWMGEADLMCLLVGSATRLARQLPLLRQHKDVIV